MGLTPSELNDGYDVALLGTVGCVIEVRGLDTLLLSSDLQQVPQA